MFSVLRSSTDLVATLLVLFAGQISAQEARKDAKVEMARNAREHTIDLQAVFK
jgi:hypothetical protein